MQKLKKGKVKLTSLAAVALAMVMGTGLVAGTAFVSADDSASTTTSSLTKYYTDYNSMEDAKKAAEDLNRQIVGEGASLLKNKDEALPMKGSEWVSVFGVKSDNLVGASDSAGAWSSDSGGSDETIADALTHAGFKVNPTLKAFYQQDSSGIGAEVCQLYISKLQSAIFRPAIELKGFKKVFLKAGESTKVRIPFDEYSFRSFNPKAGKWQTEGGEYILSVGSSSADIRLKCTVGRTGDMTDFGYDRRLLPDYFSGNAADIDGTQYIALLGHRPPKSGYDFYKKNRMVIGENSTVADLRYSKRWVGRAFSGAIRLAIWFMYSTGNRMQANTLVQGMLHQPVRGLAKYGGLSRRQMQALIMMFNGHLFKGIGTFLTKQKKGGKDK